MTFLNKVAQERFLCRYPPASAPIRVNPIVCVDDRTPAFPQLLGSATSHPERFTRERSLVRAQPCPLQKARYATLGVSDNANLDEGTMWPVAFALTELTDQLEAKIAA